MNFSQGRFPLFKGATRLPTLAGVPRTVLLVTFMFCGALFLFILLWAIGVFVFLFVIEWCITKHDDRAFRILYLAWKTKIVNRSESSFTNLWGGSSYSPRDYGDQD